MIPCNYLEDAETILARDFIREKKDHKKSISDQISLHVSTFLLVWQKQRLLEHKSQFWWVSLLSLLQRFLSGNL